MRGSLLVAERLDQNRQLRVFCKILKRYLCRRHGLTYSEGSVSSPGRSTPGAERIIFRVVGDQLLPPIEFLNCTNCSGLGQTRRLRGRKLGRSPERTPRLGLETLPTPVRPSFPPRSGKLGARETRILQVMCVSPIH